MNHATLTRIRARHPRKGRPASLRGLIFGCETCGAAPHQHCQDNCPQGRYFGYTKEPN